MGARQSVVEKNRLGARDPKPELHPLAPPLMSLDYSDIEAESCPQDRGRQVKCWGATEKPLYLSNGGSPIWFEGTIFCSAQSSIK